MKVECSVAVLALLLGATACHTSTREPSVPYVQPRPVETVESRWDGSYLLHHPGKHYTVVAPLVYDGPERPGTGLVWVTDRCRRLAQGVPYLFSDRDWDGKERFLTVAPDTLARLGLCERVHGPGYRIASLEEYLDFSAELKVSGRWFLAAPDGSVFVLQHWPAECPACVGCVCTPDRFQPVDAPSATLLCVKSTDRPEPAPPHRVAEIDRCVRRFAARRSPWPRSLDVSVLEVVLPVERACANTGDPLAWQGGVDAIERRFVTAKRVASDLSGWRSALAHLRLLDVVVARALDCGLAAPDSVVPLLGALDSRLAAFLDSAIDPDAIGVYEHPMTWRDAANRCWSCFP